MRILYPQLATHFTPFYRVFLPHPTKTFFGFITDKPLQRRGK